MRNQQQYMPYNGLHSYRQAIVHLLSQVRTVMFASWIMRAVTNKNGFCSDVDSEVRDQPAP